MNNIFDKVYFLNEKDIRNKIINLFEKEKKFLEKLIPYSYVEHIGGTSVPISLTKGDLDINVRVLGEHFQKTIQVLKSLYEINQQDNWTENFASFKDDRKDLGIQLTVINSVDDVFIVKRNFLILHPEKILELNNLKLKFQGKSMQEYRKEKSEFFDGLLN